MCWWREISFHLASSNNRAASSASSSSSQQQQQQRQNGDKDRKSVKDVGDGFSSHMRRTKCLLFQSKKPLRVFGDWSEFKSSTGRRFLKDKNEFDSNNFLGKTYFYNCKTEVSQWEKPKGWPTEE